MEKFDKIKSMLRDAEILKTARDIYVGVIKEPRCDKHGLGFNLDDRFSAFSVRVSLDSWKGYFGNRGCGKFISFDNEKMIGKALIEYLKAHQNEILKWMGDYISDEAKSEKAEAEKELTESLEYLKNID